MFEYGDIGYTPGKELDDSCYESMRTSDMVVLIIGGNYGSKASSEKEAFDEYLSVTRKEFKTAVNSNIPIFVFIDSKVATEYETFDLNQENIKKDRKFIRFRHTKDINVFYFIKEIYQLGKLPIISFDRSEDIKNFLSKQWSDMFKKYLDNLKDEKNKNTINDMQKKLSDMKSIIDGMNIMMGAVSRNVISNADEYNNLLVEQSKIRVSELCNEIAKNIKIDILPQKLNNNLKKEYVKKLLDALIRVNKIIDNAVYSSDKEFHELINNAVAKFVKELRLSKMRFYSMSNELIMANEKIIDLANNKEDYELLIKYLSQTKNFYQIFSLRYS